MVIFVCSVASFINNAAQEQSTFGGTVIFKQGSGTIAVKHHFISFIDIQAIHIHELMPSNWPYTCFTKSFTIWMEILLNSHENLVASMHPVNIKN